MLGFRQLCQSARLAGGEVLALGGQPLVLVAEGALETQQVGPGDMGQDALVVGRVAAVGVDQRRGGVARPFGDAEAVIRHRMVEREGVDSAALVLEDALAALVEVHLHPFDGESHVVAREVEGGLDHLAGSRGGHDGHRLGAAAEVHGAQQAWQAEEVVAVQVRDGDGVDALQLEVVVADAVLGGFGAVDQKFEAPDIEHLCRTAPCADGQGGSRAEYGDEHVHSSFRS